MSNNDKYIDFYSQLESSFQQSELTLWEKIEAKTIAIKQPTKTFRLNRMYIAVAASVVLLLSIGTFMRLYMTTVWADRGTHLSHVLPDDSVIELNAATKISYHPYWWLFSREVQLHGEAFFKVQKGKNFKIISKNGMTEILGTSFNIYARNEEYKVYCKTGKVRVSSTQSDVKLVINPNELAVIDNQSQKGEIINTATEEETLGWKKSKFMFSSVSLEKVLQEVERQYDVTINLDVDNASTLAYSGYFTKSKSVDRTLSLICMSFNLRYKKSLTNQYTVYSEE